MNYYNTTAESGEELKENSQRAVNQCRLILNAFRNNPHRTFTPECFKSIIIAPLTSVRRAISDLHKDGYLERFGKVKGMYGRNIYQYKYKSHG